MFGPCYDIFLTFITITITILVILDRSSSYMESACYIINAIYAAEMSCDKEMLCTLYATAVVHMRERLYTWIAPFPEVIFQPSLNWFTLGWLESESSM